MLVPPSISFKGNIKVAQLIKNKAVKFYNFIANQAEIGGVSSVSRTLPLPDGSIIRVSSYKEGNYGLRTGSVVIVGSGVGLEEKRDEIQLIIRLPSGVFLANLSGEDVALTQFTKEVGFSFSWSNSKDLTCSFEGDFLYIGDNKYSLSSILSSELILTVALKTKKSGYILAINYDLTLVRVYTFVVSGNTLDLAIVFESGITDFYSGEIIIDTVGNYKLILIHDSNIDTIKLKDITITETVINFPGYTTTISSTFTDIHNFTSDISTTPINLDGYFTDSAPITNTFRGLCIPVINISRTESSHSSLSYVELDNVVHNTSTGNTNEISTKSRLSESNITLVPLLEENRTSNSEHHADGNGPYSVSHIFNQNTEGHTSAFIDSQVIVDNEYRFNITGGLQSYTTLGFPLTEHINYPYITSESVRNIVYVGNTQVYEEIISNTSPHNWNVSIGVIAGSYTPPGTTTSYFSNYDNYSPALGKLYAYTDKLYAVKVNKTLLIFPVKNKIVQPTILYQYTAGSSSDIKLALHLKSI